MVKKTSKGKHIVLTKGISKVPDFNIVDSRDHSLEIEESTEAFTKKIMTNFQDQDIK